MIDNTSEIDKGLESALKALEQAKARVANEKKKQNEKKRKAENHHKYMMGGIVAKYFQKCCRFDEQECKMEQIFHPIYGVRTDILSEVVRAPFGDSCGGHCLSCNSQQSPTVRFPHLPYCVLCVQTKAKKRLLSAHKVCVCHPAVYRQNVGDRYG